VQALYGRGTCHDALERYHEAISDYERALTLRPDAADVWYAKADALFNLRRTEESIACYQRALALAPEDFECWHDYGATCLEGGNDDEAVRAFAECIRIDPTWPDGYVAMAKAMCLSVDYDAAFSNLQMAYTLDPTLAQDFDEEFSRVAGPFGVELLRSLLKL
jgi:tetratricopeptide (TPR) repeat protein